MGWRGVPAAPRVRLAKGASRTALVQHLCLDQLCSPALELCPLARRTDSYVPHMTACLRIAFGGGRAIDLS